MYETPAAPIAEQSPEREGGKYELLDPAVLHDPYPVYRQMRAHAPVYRDRRFLGWILTRYDDVLAVLRDPRVSSQRPLASEPVGRSLASVTAEVREIRGFQAGWMMHLDPPEHTRLRTLVNKAFTSTRVEGLRRTVQALTDELLSPARETGCIDLVHDLARPLPALVIGDLLGVSREDRPSLQAWSDGIAAGMVLSGRGQAALDGLREAHRSQRELVDYFRRLIVERRRRPKDDLLSGFIAAEENGSMLGDDEVIGMCVLLLFAGQETTTHLIGNGLLTLLEHPGQLARLRDEPALIERAVEEFLRFDCPVQATGRRATVAMDIGGQFIEPGDFLTPVIGAANRDPKRFARPDELDITRDDNRHLGFAHGPHYCLGAPLARLEGQIAIATVVLMFTSLEPAGPAKRRQHFYLRGLESLSVRVRTR
jgi:pimeloyl-[acyl-carrier protein] synthase